MRSCIRFQSVGVAALVAMLAAGCGESGPRTYPVSGTVTFDGQPVPSGHIILSPHDGSVAPDAAEIHDGKFSFRARPGKKRVEINAAKPTGPVDPIMKVAEYVPYIPSRYNTESTLEIEVVEDGENRWDFPLDSGTK